MAEREKRYTKGPWAAKGQEVKGVAGVCVAFCGEAATFGEGGSYRISKWGAEYNAALVAAAPELLEALEALQERINTNTMSGDTSKAYGEAQRAIAKAYGEGDNQ